MINVNAADVIKHNVYANAVVVNPYNENNLIGIRRYLAGTYKLLNFNGALSSENFDLWMTLYKDKPLIMLFERKDWLSGILPNRYKYKHSLPLPCFFVMVEAAFGLERNYEDLNEQWKELVETMYTEFNKALELELASGNVRLTTDLMYEFFKATLDVHLDQISALLHHKPDGKLVKNTWYNHLIFIIKQVFNNSFLKPK